MGFNPSEFNATSNGDRPVEDLNWTEALAFCEQLTIRERNAGRIPTDWAYVLPTESQWEYACRAGTTTVYSWGDDINSSHANYSGSGVDADPGSGAVRAQSLGLFRYARQCLGVDRRLVRSGVPHGQSDNRSYRTRIGLASGPAGWFLGQRRGVPAFG